MVSGSLYLGQNDFAGSLVYLNYQELAKPNCSISAFNCHFISSKRIIEEQTELCEVELMLVVLKDLLSEIWLNCYSFRILVVINQRAFFV